jgi:transcriptional regulator with XRE-family HTH domain
MKNLKKIRMEKGFKQYEVAKHIGVDRTTYSNYETGKRDPDTDTVIKIATLFEVTTDSLLGQEKPLPQKEKPAEVGELDEDIKELLAIQNRLDLEKRKEVLNFAKFQLSEQNQ